MAKLTPKKIDLSILNNGNKYNKGDGISSEAINSSIESAAYTQALATTQPDVSEANNVGIPSVEIKEINGLPKFKFKNIKGEKGDSGVASGTVNSNAEGTSDTDGYTQQAVNKIASRPNLIINPDFSINQRGQKSYSGNNIYTVDRWRTYNNMTFNVATKTLTNNETTLQGFFTQFNENFNSLYGKTVTISCLIDNVKYSATATLALSYPSIQVIAQTGTTNTKFELSYNTTRGIFVQFRLNAGVSAVVDECKLEIGSVATAFMLPLREEELPKCYRYYQRYNFANNMPLPLGIARNAQTVSINFNVPKLRTTPTFTTSGTVKLLNQGITGLTLVNNQYYDGVYRMFIETSGLSAGTGILIAGDTDGYYALDAEIY